MLVSSEAACIGQPLRVHLSRHACGGDDILQVQGLHTLFQVCYGVWSLPWLRSGKTYRDFLWHF